METTDFIEEQKDYAPVKCRYYLDKKVLLEVENAISRPSVGDGVCIDKINYIVTDTSFNPVSLLWMFNLKKR